MLPELEEFRRRVQLLRERPSVAGVLDGNRVRLASLGLSEVDELLRDDVGYYFLLAATGLNRTTLKKAAEDEAAQLVARPRRRAHAMKVRLPISEEFNSIAANAVALRSSDLRRKTQGQTEQIFRERLAHEGVPLLMSPPRRVVPGVLVSGRKPDGVWPDPKTGLPPVIYLEVKSIRRVADDIQKRLYELAEASLEMKLLYGDIELKGLNLRRTAEVGKEETGTLLRQQVLGRRPVVVGLFLCPKAQAERYRAGAHAFIDRIYFQEEIEECIRFIDDTISSNAELGVL